MFVLHTLGGVSTPPLEYLPAGNIKPEIGKALVLQDGLLKTVDSAAAPTYICMTQKDELCTAGERIPVIRVQHEHVFETTAAEEADAVSLGDKLAISADGMQVDPTAAGMAELVWIEDDNQAGCRVRVRF